MEEKTISILINFMPFLISAMAFLLIYIIAKSYHPAQYFIKTYERINNRLKEQKSGLFDYNNIQQFLTANGAAFHYGAGINPTNYIMMRIIISTGGFGVGIQFHWTVAVMAAVLGFYLPSFYLMRANMRDNDGLLPQLQTMYNTLMVQIKAGVYITDALAECYHSFPKGRLRTALEEMNTELFVNKSFDEVLERFNSKFNNTFIDTLCVILKQAQESGQAVDLLRDMSEQLKDMKAARLLKKKESLDRSITFCLLGIMAAMIAVIVYACVTDMFGAASSL